MSNPEDEQKPGGLTPEQSSSLEDYIDRYVKFSHSNPRLTGYYDQTSAQMRNTLAEKFDLTLDTPEQHYIVMAGLSVGVVWLEGLVATGLSISDAVVVVQTSLARLFPDQPNIT